MKYMNLVYFFLASLHLMIKIKIEIIELLPCLCIVIKNGFAVSEH